MGANTPQQDSQARLRWRKLVDNLPSSVVFVLDRSLVVTFAGGSLATNNAFRPERYLQRNARDFIPPDVFARIEPHLQSTTKKQRVQRAVQWQSRVSWQAAAESGLHVAAVVPGSYRCPQCDRAFVVSACGKRSVQFCVPSP